MAVYRVTEEQLASGQPVSQGEVNFWLKQCAPADILDGLSRLKLSIVNFDRDTFIVGHSETGHHHILRTADRTVPFSQAAQALIDESNDTIIGLKLMQECELVHLRNADTHHTIILPPGEYVRVIRQEQAPEGWRRVSD